MDKIPVNKPSPSGALPPKVPLSTVPEKKADLKPTEPRPSVATAIKSPPAISPAPAPAVATTAAPQTREVKIELYQRNARAVFLAGTFNNWNPQATPLKTSGKGKWEITITLPPGKYEYRFIVDGKWIEDPLAKECVPNPFEGSNSILVVK